MEKTRHSGVYDENFELDPAPSAVVSIATSGWLHNAIGLYEDLTKRARDGLKVCGKNSVVLRRFQF